MLGEGGDAVLRGLGELRERGVRLAVDVSAAGYGSLARLGQHPVDLVRIGPDLVAGLGVDAAAEILIRALVRVGRDLGIAVVADGIERAEQRDLLAAMGCTLGLGPFVAAPAPPASSLAWPVARVRAAGWRPGRGWSGDGRRTRPAGEMAGGPGLGGERLAGERLAVNAARAASRGRRAASSRSATSSRPPVISPAETNGLSS